MQVTILSVSGKNTKKDGTPMINKWGKPYCLVTINTSLHGIRTGFMDSVPAWANTIQELELYEEEYQGNPQLKFRVPRTSNSTPPAITLSDDAKRTFDTLLRLETKIDAIGRMIKVSPGVVDSGTYPVNDLGQSPF